MNSCQAEKEKREAKKQREREKKEQLKKEGKYMTEKQKRDKARAEAMLQAMRAQGMDVPATTGEKRGPRLGTRVRSVLGFAGGQIVYTTDRF